MQDRATSSDQAQRRAGLPGCHCLCSLNHPGEPHLCGIYADLAVPFDSQLTGPVFVQMCRACAKATASRRAEQSEAPPKRGSVECPKTPPNEGRDNPGESYQRKEP